MHARQDERHIVVHDVLGETRELLEFRDPVVKMALGERGPGVNEPAEHVMYVIGSITPTGRGATHQAVNHPTTCSAL